MSRLTTEPLPLRVSTNGAGPTDVDLLRSLRWTDGATPLAAAARRGDATAFARELRRDLVRRFGKKAADAGRLASRFPSHEAEARAVAALFVEPGTSAALTGATHSLVGVAALVEGLRRFGGALAPQDLWILWREAWLRSAEAAAGRGESPLDRVLAAEIDWARGILFAGTAEAKRDAKAGRSALLAEFEARTDTGGTPHADLLPILPAWFASLTRAAGWAKAADLRLWNAEYASRFDGLLRTAAILASPDGRLFHSDGGDVRPVLREAFDRSGWKPDSPVAGLVRRLRRDNISSVPAAESVPRRPDRKSPPVLQSDWAKLVVSRSRWRPDADAFTITHHGPTPTIEFMACGRVVLSGPWGLRVRVDGDQLEPTADWEAVSWFSDRDADYLELQRPNERGVVVCRQLLLTRGDHQLVVADSVSTPSRPDARLEVEATLPLAPGVASETRRPTRELRLAASDLPLRAFPVGLPTERIEKASGAFDAAGGALVMKGSGAGGVYLPLVLDWHPKRREAIADWRTLTVTEDRRRLGPAEASGHRLRVGDRQLLVYRGLNGSKAKRTMLGYHHGNESVIGRFNGDGDVEPLVLVE